MDIPSPGPGGFASSGPFAPRPGIHLTPARTREMVGRYSGPGLPHGTPAWVWLLGIALLVVVVAAVVSVITRRG